MFFVLSKILLFLLMPFWWVLILFTWRCFSKSVHVKKRLLVCIVLILMLFTNPFLYRLAVNAWQPEPTILKNSAVFEAGIILGGLSGYDEYNRGHFNSNADRFIQTANLYHRGIIKKIIITGGTGKLRQNEPGEAPFLKDQFIFNGVKEADIIIESNSKNTYENAIFTKKIIDSLHLRPPFVLVTSAFHMTRSAWVFKKAGYDFIAFPADDKVIHKKFEAEDALLPDIYIMNQWSTILKEIIGLGVYRLTGKA